MFFDIDDTIFDYKKCSEAALKKTCQRLKTVYSKQLLLSYRKLDNELWGQQKQGKLTVAQVIQKRANGIATEMEKPDIGSKFEVTFGDELGKSTEPIEGVGKALEYVYRKGYNLFCASNGIKTMQINRMQEAGLLN